MPKAAILGSPVEHSLSPVLHGAGYKALGMEDWEYERMECTADELQGIVEKAGDEYRGFSVTMPNKFAALEFADEVTERAQLIGSANTLARTERGWRADNTDCEGILVALGELFPNQDEIHRGVVIGSGGTARPAIWALGSLGVKDLTVINRSDRSAELKELVEHFGIDCTFVGFDADLEAITMASDLIVSTVPAAAIEEHVKLLAHAPTFDVIYEPWPTPLVKQAAANGYRTVGGHVMLAAQSYSQFEQFTGQPAPREAMRQALMDHLR